MAYFSFAKAIIENQPIQVFNHGKMKRDFTYIDDIVDGIINVMQSPAQPDPNWDSKHPDPSRSTAPYRIYNIGNNKPVELLNFVQQIEKNIGKKATIEFKDMQPGDVTATWANVDDLIENFDYTPNTSIENGLERFIEWYKGYYHAQ
jgi:UDP-glucuronate 4-epimerase